MFNAPLQHRARFQPNVFHRESPDEESAKKDPEHASRADTMVLPPSPEDAEIRQSWPKMTTWKMTVQRLSEVERYRTAGRRDAISSRSRTSASERAALRKAEMGILQSVEEVWFAGCHSDVGGQYPTFYHKLFLILTCPQKVDQSQMTVGTLSLIYPSDGWSSRS